MFSAAEKTANHTNLHNKHSGQATFFKKAGQETFSEGYENRSFFHSSIQPKLTISQPDDPYEKEADAVAENVMRMPEPVIRPANEKEEDKLQRKEEDEKEDIQPKLQTPQISAIQREENEEEEETVQTKQLSLYRKGGAGVCSKCDERAEQEINHGSLQKKSNSYQRSNLIQRNGRAPPTPSANFQDTLNNSGGGGNALPDSSRGSMESRFNADFSGVRIHTGSTAETLSNSINAQAFTHGNDIYFNSGKFSPHTADGGLLLAHELTHTIQQGASKTSLSPRISRKSIIQRSAGGVPQLANAVTKAKTEEGKVNANKEGPDGNRTGWERLVEYFKTTFGEEKIVNGNSAIPGSIAEQDIKKKRDQHGVAVVDQTTLTSRQSIGKTKLGSRDAMPSWCGIFVFWALNKGGVPMPKWKLGEQMIKPDTARTPGSLPVPGDIAYRNAFSHFAIVESVNGSNVRTVNGNTAGEDNLGGQVQMAEHPISDWTAFFDPMLIKTGSLQNAEGETETKPKTLDELRKDLSKVNRKPQENDEPEITEPVTEQPSVQAKPALSNWSVDAGGVLSTVNSKSNNLGDPLILPKEEEKTEVEKERQSGSNLWEIQKKQTSSEFINQPTANNVSSNPNPKSDVQLSTNNTNSSLNVYRRPQEGAFYDERDRGPPHLSQVDRQIQRSVIDDALSFISTRTILGCVDITDENATKTCVLQKAQEVALHIPGYKALRVVLGQDPITGQHIDRNGRNFIEASFDIMPGGSLLHQKLDEQHQLDTAANWIDARINQVDELVNGLFSRFSTFFNALEATDLLSPLDVIRNGAAIVLGFINQIIDFAKNAAIELLDMVKAFLLNTLVDFIKEHTTAYPLLTVILGKDPVTEQTVVRNGTNILNALLELGGEEGKQQRTQMQETGTFQKVVGYIDEGISVFGTAYDEILQAFHNIWNIVGIESLIDPVGIFTEIYNQFAGPIQKVWDFVKKVAAEILKLIKEVLMQRLSVWAKKQRGYDLVTVIIGKDPFTDAVVPRSAENLIRGFMGLMEGGKEQYDQLKESGAIDRTVAKVNKAVARLNMTPAYIVQLFIDLWDSFSLNDLAHPIVAFQRIIGRFGEPIGRLIAFVIEIVKIVIEAILIVMNFPFDLINNIIAKAMQAFELIKKDPVGFLKNLLRAIKEGFMQFFDNILTHLFNGLKAWFLSEVQAAGIPIPTDFTVMGIIKWLLAVLDVTMEKIWKKLEERIGKPKVDKIKKMIAMAEKAASAAGEAYAFMQDVQQRGFMAVMVDKVKEQLSNVWEMVLDAVKSFVMDQIIKKVTTKLLSMLDPTGIMAVVNSVIALYKAIQSFIRYLRQMLEIVNSFVEGTLQIAQGATKKAADFLEGALSSSIPIVIGFLANQVGLNLSERLKDALEVVREKVDKGLTWVIDKVVTLIEKLVSLGKAAVGKVMGWLGVKKDFRAKNGEEHQLTTGENGKELMVASGTPQVVRPFLASLNVGSNPEMISKRTHAQSKLTEMDQHLIWMAAPPVSATDLQKEARKELIELLATEISNDLAELMVFAGNNDIPKTTPPVYDGTIGGFWGKGMRVQIIKTPPSGGSVTSSSHAHDSWKALRERYQGGRTLYVKGHLLNNHLGGPGTNWNNLTPLTQNANGEFERDSESYIKNRLSITTGTSADAKRADTGLLFIYTVIPAYGRSLNSGLLNAINAIPVGPGSLPGSPPAQLSTADKTTLLNIVTHEQYVPTTIRYDIIVKDPATDKEMEQYSVRNHQITNDIETNSYSIDSGTYVF